MSGPRRGGLPAWWMTRLALHLAGATAVRLTPGTTYDLASFHGFVLGGGADVAEPFGEPIEEEDRVADVPWRRRITDNLVAPPLLVLRLLGKVRTHGVDPARDALESVLLAHARNVDLPVLGICRGAQLMNLAGHGTLARNIHLAYVERPHIYSVLPRRRVRLEPDSRLGQIMQCSQVLVNSMHYHAVNDAGTMLRVVAREQSGVAQAIEDSSRAFWIGVQWHPEYLPQHAAHRRIFGALVEEARAGKAARTAHS